jgi:hypothetical protein
MVWKLFRANIQYNCFCLTTTKCLSLLFSLSLVIIKVIKIVFRNETVVNILKNNTIRRRWQLGTPVVDVGDEGRGRARAMGAAV